MHCPGCAKENPADARFCAFCGKPLPETPGIENSPTLTVALDAAPAANEAREDPVAPRRTMGRADDLLCPQCKTPNTPEAETCNACNAALREPCAACGKPRRVGLIHCNHCGADGMASRIAASHRDAAQRAMNERRLKDAIEELYELSNLVRAHGPELGPLAALQSWSEKESARLKVNREKAQQLAEQGRVRVTEGRIKGATERLTAAAALDCAFDQELSMLQNPPAEPISGLGGNVPVHSPQHAYDALTGSVRTRVWSERSDEAPLPAMTPLGQKPTSKIEDKVPLPVAPLGQKPPTAKQNNTLPADAIKAKCNACGVVIVTRKAMLEKLTACPKCKATPFQHTLAGL
jgi:hypothetical protein